MMITVNLRTKLSHKRRQDLINDAKLILGPTRIKPGCISCRLYQDLDEPDAVFLVEEWESREKLDRHFDSEQYRNEMIVAIVGVLLLVGVSSVKAFEVKVDASGTAYATLDLEVEGKDQPYNVEFRYESAIDVYGSGLVTDFPPPDGDETIILALEAVTDALNFEDPTPPGAGSQGTYQFFIGYKEEDGAFVAVGGENFSGAWDYCATDCINVGEIKTGVTLLEPDETATYADFIVAD